MEAPDVIYVGIRDIGSGYVTDVSIYPEEEHQEYIRKDVLLKLLEDEKFYIDRQEESDCYWNKVLNSVIDKINKL